MIYISHRGNTTGINKERENSPEYIQEAIDGGFLVEVDVWVTNSIPFLGHDKPQYEVKWEFLVERSTELICHAKNQEALSYLTKKDMHCFAHDLDPFVVTSRGLTWAFPGEEKKGSIAVMPESNDTNKYYMECIGVIGICSDIIKTYRDT